MAYEVKLRDNALTTLEALKSFMGLDPADTEDAMRDNALLQLINAASAWLETQLGRKLGKRSYREKHTATGTQRLVLEQWPILEIAKITDTDYDVEIDGYDFDEQGEIGVVYREEGWTYRGHVGGLSRDFIAPRRHLLVEYTAGYVLPKNATKKNPSTLPSDLEAVIWNMVAQQYAIIENDAAGLSAFSISDVSWTFDKNIPDTWASVISSYRRW